MSGLETAFPGKIEAHNVDATTDTSKAEVQALGFRNHGLVIRDPEGAVLWKQPDHDVKVEDAQQAIQELLAKRG